MVDFKDKVVMITGASGNLGCALVNRFERAGAKLALLDRDEARLRQLFPELSQQPERAFLGAADLTDSDQVAQMVARIISQLGRIDILTHPVGGYQAGTPLHETELETLDYMLTLNVRTAFIVNQAVIPQMIQQGSGKIINVAARAGVKGTANMAAYSAAKAAVIRLTESSAAELKHLGINVNCILPGTIDTPQNRAAMPDADTSRWVTPDSLAAVIQFLASAGAADIHGAAIPVYGRS